MPVHAGQGAAAYSRTRSRMRCVLRHRLLFLRFRPRCDYLPVLLICMGAAASSRGEAGGAGESGAGEEQKADGGDGRTIKFADEELDDDADRKQARNHAAAGVGAC